MSSSFFFSQPEHGQEQHKSHVGGGVISWSMQMYIATEWNVLTRCYDSSSRDSTHETYRNTAVRSAFSKLQIKKTWYWMCLKLHVSSIYFLDFFLFIFILYINECNQKTRVSERNVLNYHCSFVCVCVCVSFPWSHNVKCQITVDGRLQSKSHHYHHHR